MNRSTPCIRRDLNTVWFATMPPATHISIWSHDRHAESGLSCKALSSWWGPAALEQVIPFSAHPDCVQLVCGKLAVLSLANIACRDKNSCWLEVRIFSVLFSPRTYSQLHSAQIASCTAPGLAVWVHRVLGLHGVSGSPATLQQPIAHEELSVRPHSLNAIIQAMFRGFNETDPLPCRPFQSRPQRNSRGRFSKLTAAQTDLAVRYNFRKVPPYLSAVMCIPVPHAPALEGVDEHAVPIDQ